MPDTSKADASMPDLYLDALSSADVINHHLELTMQTQAEEAEILELVDQAVSGPIFRLHRGSYAFNLDTDSAEELSLSLTDFDGVLRGFTPSTSPNHGLDHSAITLLGTLRDAAIDNTDAMTSKAVISAGFAVETARMTAEGLVGNLAQTGPILEQLSRIEAQFSDEEHADSAGRSMEDMFSEQASLLQDMLRTQPDAPQITADQFGELSAQIQAFEKSIHSDFPGVTQSPELEVLSETVSATLAQIRENLLGFREVTETGHTELLQKFRAVQGESAEALTQAWQALSDQVDASGGAQDSGFADLSEAIGALQGNLATLTDTVKGESEVASAGISTLAPALDALNSASETLLARIPISFDPFSKKLDIIEARIGEVQADIQVQSSRILQEVDGRLSRMESAIEEINHSVSDIAALTTKSEQAIEAITRIEAALAKPVNDPVLLAMSARITGLEDSLGTLVARLPENPATHEGQTGIEARLDVFDATLTAQIDGSRTAQTDSLAAHLEPLQEKLIQVLGIMETQQSGNSGNITAMLTEIRTVLDDQTAFLTANNPQPDTQDIEPENKPFSTLSERSSVLIRSIAEGETLSRINGGLQAVLERIETQATMIEDLTPDLHAKHHDQPPEPTGDNGEILQDLKLILAEFLAIKQRDFGEAPIVSAEAS